MQGKHRRDLTRYSRRSWKDWKTETKGSWRQGSLVKECDGLTRLDRCMYPSAFSFFLSFFPSWSFLTRDRPFQGRLFGNSVTDFHVFSVSWLHTDRVGWVRVEVVPLHFDVAWQRIYSIQGFNTIERRNSEHIDFAFVLFQILTFKWCAFLDCGTVRGIGRGRASTLRICQQPRYK